MAKSIINHILTATVSAKQLVSPWASYLAAFGAAKQEAQGLTKSILCLLWLFIFVVYFAAIFYK